MIPKMPKFITCANCGKNIEYKSFMKNISPPKNASAERIHKSYSPTILDYTVCCPSCGHYTINIYGYGPKAEE